MKKIKISILAIFAIVVAIVGSAFTSAEPTNQGALDGWFIYNGGDIDDPLSYTYSTSIAPCNEHVQFCAFKGDRQVGNQSRPTQQSLDDAMSASQDFENEVEDLVVFKE